MHASSYNLYNNNITFVRPMDHLIVVSGFYICSDIFFCIFPCDTLWKHSTLKNRMRIDAFELWNWRRLLRIPWVAKKINK